MLKLLRSLDRLLRGETTRGDALANGDVPIPIFGFLLLIDLLGMTYGLCMGLFSVTQGGSHHNMQILATTLKVPALFILTLLVTFPSLYVFNALVGSPLLFGAVFRLLLSFLAIMLATLASIGPIVGFFSFTTTSYSFMVLLNVLVFSISGLLGLTFLLQTMNRLSRAMSGAAIPVGQAKPLDESGGVFPPPLPASESGPLHFHQPLAPRVKFVFLIWVAVFGLVGAQMAWVLRPFIGHPGMDFTWFRHPDSNFFQAVLHAAQNLLS